MADVLTAGNMPAHGSNSFVASVKNFFETLLTSRQEQKILDELYSLDDRLLDDIGLSRMDLSDWHKTGVRPTH